MSLDLSNIDQALDQAHFPALLVALSHITGNTAHLTDRYKPVYDFFTDSRLGGLSDEKQAEIKALAPRVHTDI